MEKDRKNIEAEPEDDGSTVADMTAEDDGSTVADMNVEGMPWYVAGDKERAEARERAHAAGEPDQLTDEQMRIYRWAAIKAGLLIVLVFGGSFAAFLAFCDFIWFR